MNNNAQEALARAAFSKQAVIFDQLDRDNAIIGWMRDRVHQEVLRFARKGNRMLELNCGTGIDAIYFAEHGLNVLATDNSPDMIRQLNRKVTSASMAGSVEAQQCSFSQLPALDGQAPFDYVFSNFGGLNCTDRLDLVLSEIDRLLKPGGYFTLVLMPKVCPWEMLMLFRGYFKTAFRRLRSGGVQAKVEGLPFQCYYYNPAYITQRTSSRFELASLRSLGLTVPPPYMEHFRERHGGLFRFLARLEDWLCHLPVLNGMGDHLMITMKKREDAD